MPNCFKQNIWLHIIFSICLSILGIAFSIAWSSLQYFILTGFSLIFFLMRIYHIYQIYKTNSYITMTVQCKSIKKSLYDQAMCTYYFKMEDGETITLKLNKYLNTIELEENYILYFEKYGSGMIRNYIGIEHDKGVT